MGRRNLGMPVAKQGQALAQQHDGASYDNEAIFWRAGHGQRKCFRRRQKQLGRRASPRRGFGQKSQARSARGAGASEEDLIHDGKENFSDLVDGFVLHARKNESTRTCNGQGGKCGAKGPRAGRIVGGIQKNRSAGKFRRGLKELEATRPGCCANSLLYRSAVEGETMVSVKLDGGGDGERDIALLVFTRQGRVDGKGIAVQQVRRKRELI